MVERRRASGVTRQRVHASSVCGSLLCEVDVEEVEVQRRLYDARRDRDGVDHVFCPVPERPGEPCTVTAPNAERTCISNWGCRTRGTRPVRPGSVS